MLTCIRGSRMIDPARRDVTMAADPSATCELWMRDGQIIDAPRSHVTPEMEIDASGCITMAGGIDLHTHIGGGKVSLARMLLQDQMPPWRTAEPAGSDLSSESRFLPSAGVTASRYLDMGYTTCFEPAVIPCNARSAHAEMADVRGIDTGGYCLLGNDDVLLQLIAEKSPQEVINAYVAWMVLATRCIAVKVVNPGGINAFKFNQRSFDVDTPHPRNGVTPGQIVRTLCRAVHELGLAHPLHVHCSNLGVPGNIRSTLATIAAADGYPIHLTHAQFHCYGDAGPYHFSSSASQLAEAMAKHRNVTIDVGQIQFGQTVTISADSMHQHLNSSHAKPRKSILVDVECEAGCGVVPFKYRRREFVHSLQWAIGLELFLMIDDPARVFLTTDHPNGGPFTAYPHLLGLLADRDLREAALAEIHPEAAGASSLAGISREYSLNDIATMTRAAPAKILGLRDRGTLATGSVADVVVYQQQDNIEKMFRVPKYVFKSGKLIRHEGQDVKGPDDGVPDRTLAADLRATGAQIDRRQLADFRIKYARNGTFALDRLWIDDTEMEEVLGSQTLATGLRNQQPTASVGVNA